MVLDVVDQEYHRSDSNNGCTAIPTLNGREEVIITHFIYNIIYNER